jgi:hypothetical protein
MRFTAPAIALLLLAAAACSASPGTTSPGPDQPPTFGSSPTTPTTDPTLGEAFLPETRGYGSVRPSVIDAGGSGTSVLTEVRWTAWGGPRAIGTGKATYVAPGQANAAGHPEPADITAGDLGRCPDGRVAYRSITWTFPAHPGAERAEFSDICARA